MSGEMRGSEHLAGIRVAEPAHATPLTYVKIVVVLAVVTLVEFSALYVEALGAILVPFLLVLSAAKFALVAMFYMHLKFDSRMFSGFFVSGILVATLVAIALLALFHQIFV